MDFLKERISIKNKINRGVHKWISYHNSLTFLDFFRNDLNLVGRILKLLTLSKGSFDMTKWRRWEGCLLLPPSLAFLGGCRRHRRFGAAAADSSLTDSQLWIDATENENA